MPVPETLLLESMENNAYNAAMVDAMSAGLRVLSTTDLTTLQGLANALCVVAMSTVSHSQSEKKNFGGIEHMLPYKEPKFRHISSKHGGISRSRLEEAIVCFLITLLPANQLIPHPKSAREIRLQKEAPGAVTDVYDVSETLLHIIRFLESYLHFVYDANGTQFFTGLSLRQAPWCSGWEAELVALLLVTGSQD